MHPFHIGSTALQCDVGLNTLLLTGEIRAVCIPVGTANQSSIKLSLSLSFSPFFSALSETGQWERVGTRLSMMYEIFELGGGGQESIGAPNQSRSSWSS